MKRARQESQTPRPGRTETARPPAGRAAGVAAGLFLAALGVSAFLFAFPLLAAQGLLPLAALGPGVSVYFLAGLLAAPLAGAAAERLGGRRLLFFAALAGAVAPLACLVTTHLATLLAAQLCLGLAGAVFRTAGPAVLAVARQEEAGRALGRYAAWQNAAFLLGPILGGLLFLERRPGPVIVFLCACLAAAAALFVWAGREGERGRGEASGGQRASALWNPVHASRRSLDVQRSTRSMMGFPKGGSPPLAAGGLPPSSLPSLPRLRLFVAVAGRTALVGALTAFYPVLLHERLRVPAFVLGLLFAAPNLAAFPGLAWSGRLADRFSGRERPGDDRRPLLILGGMAASALAFACLPLAASVWAFALVGALMGLGSLFSLPACLALAGQTGPGGGARGLGLFQAASGLGFFLGPLFAGAILARSGSLGAVFPALALLCLAALTPLLGLVFERRAHYARRAANLLAGGCLLAVLIPGVLFLGRFWSAGETEPGLRRFVQPAMGTVLTLTLEEPDPERAQRAAVAAFAKARELQWDLDHRNPAGSTGRINLAAGLRPAAVSREAFELIERALAHGVATDWAFDPAVGAVTTAPLYFLRDPAWAKNRKALADGRLVRLDPGRRTVFLPLEGMALDLGGLAKGHVVDACAAVLRQAGIRAALVEAGGDFVCYGDRDWRVGLRHPRRPGLIGTIVARNVGVCGSGDYEQFVDGPEPAGAGPGGGAGAAGRRHHVLDPTTMESARQAAGVTVMAPSAEQADALATALMVLSPERGAAILARGYPGAEALWVPPDGETRRSPGFPEIEKP